MATLNIGWSVVQSALEADQGALDIVAGNTANASTPGYSVELPELAQSDVLSIGNGAAMPSGVMLTDAASQRDRVLNERINQQTQENSASTARLSALNDLQSVFSGALGTSGSEVPDIGTDMANLFDAFSQMSENPTDMSLRGGVLAAANQLAGSFNQAANSLSAQQASLDQTASSLVSQVNALSVNIAALNGQIVANSPNGDAGQLEDQRQADLASLSALLGTHQIRTDANGLTITTAGGSVLVEGSASQPLSTAVVGAVTHFFLATRDITSDLTGGGGELGGLLTVRDSDLPNAMSQLDNLAYSVASKVNAANMNGTNGNGMPGAAIFGIPAGAARSAAQITVSLADSQGIAAAGAGLGSADGSNASAMGDLASQAIVSGASPADFYASFLTGIGSLVTGVQADGAAQKAALTQLTTQQSALSSVNLNDEAASLESFEQAYQAASKVFSILNTVMASAINLGVETTVS